MSAPQPPRTELENATEAVRTLAEIMQSSGLHRIDVQVGDTSICLQSGGIREGVGSPRAVEPQMEAQPATADPPQVPSRHHVITAPMIGTFYHSAGPGEAAFVKVGDRIESGQTIGIIEAMKIMNEIAADRGGIVVEIVAANSQAVEYGSPLLRVTPAED